MKRFFILPLLLLACGACDILEEDISKDPVRVIAPTDKACTGAGTVKFRWHGVEYATGYEFTLVSPSFEYADRLVADTVIYADSLSRSYGFDATLCAGRYQWRVTAFNSGYNAVGEINTLTVVNREEE